MTTVDLTEVVSSDEGRRPTRRRPRRRSLRLSVVVFALSAIPLVVVAVAQTRSRWWPFLDQAMIELLVRDVGGPHSPTTGLVGRFTVDGVEATHPGPLSWYLLAPPTACSDRPPTP